MAAHWSSIYLNEKLFRRVDAVHAKQASLALEDQQVRLLDKTHRDFVRSGANLVGAARTRFAAISERLAELTTHFSHNLLGEMAAFHLVLPNAAHLDGLSPEAIAAAQERATKNGRAPGACELGLNEATVLQVLRAARSRALRQQVYTAWKARGTGAPSPDPGPAPSSALDSQAPVVPPVAPPNGGESKEDVHAVGRPATSRDNRPLVTEMLRLRQEQAALLGFPNYAAFSLAPTMAGSVARVRELLEPVWQRACGQAALEERELHAAAAADDVTQIQPWDWMYYAEHVRQARLAVSNQELRAYFPLDAMLTAAFDVAGRLFGVTLHALPDAPRFHSDVRVWEVRGKDGAHVGVLMGDYFARPSKQSGAWMDEFRSQSGLPHEVRPVVLNVLNIAPPAPGQQALLSTDEVTTLFHEFGHGLHGLLSSVRYPGLAGTRVVCDFLEFPSQMMEHWGREAAVLRQHARHYQTGEPLPETLMAALEANGRFGQGFATVEYAASALADLAAHELSAKELTTFDPDAFENSFRASMGVPAAIALRHRLPHFLHLFAGQYAARYYVYLWANVLDADGYEAFLEARDPFDPTLAASLLAIYRAGNSVDPVVAYRAFRGRDPDVAALLRQRGLASSSTAGNSSSTSAADM
jgi:peptidyl-dipeptidase Dcp